MMKKLINSMFGWTCFDCRHRKYKSDSKTSVGGYDGADFYVCDKCKESWVSQ